MTGLTKTERRCDRYHGSTGVLDECESNRNTILPERYDRNVDLSFLFGSLLYGGPSDRGLFGQVL